MAGSDGVDSMYMENLDEFINDENKVVTYRWLSTTLKVHVNQAKQMLYNFVIQQRNNKSENSLNVSYFLAGLQKHETSTKLHRCEVVSEEKLEAVKSTFEKLYSCHIYSVQKSKLQESDALYITDYNLMKENIFESCKHSSIKFTTAKHVTSEPVVQEIKQEETTSSILDNDTKPKKLENNENATTSKNRMTNKTGIAGMFAKASLKKNSPKSNEQTQNSSETETKETVKKNSTVSKKSPSVMAFFANSTAKRKSPEEKPISIKKEPTVIPNKKRTSEEKKKSASSDSDDDFVQQKKKRRRIKDDLFDSSSEEELEAEEPVSSPEVPVESNEEKQDEEKQDEEEIEEDEAPIPDTPEQNMEKVKKESSSSSSIISNGKKRKQIKRKKKRTFLNDENFLVTEYVMESDSTDASDIEQSSTKDSNPLKLSTVTKKLSVTATAAKATADKGKPKQASLMSFFSKK